MLVKAEASAFATGPAAGELKARGDRWLVVAGVWTEACVDATVKDAIALGFRVLLVKDACGSGSAAMHQTGILNLANRLYGGAVTSTDGACRLMAGDTVDVWMVEGSVPLRFTYENAAETSTATFDGNRAALTAVARGRTSPNPGPPMNRGKYEALLDPAIWAYVDRINGWYPPEILALPMDRQRTIYDAMCRAFHQGYPAERRGNRQRGSRPRPCDPDPALSAARRGGGGDGRLLSWRRLRPRRPRQP